MKAAKQPIKAKSTLIAANFPSRGKSGAVLIVKMVEMSFTEFLDLNYSKGLFNTTLVLPICPLFGRRKFLCVP